MKIVFYAYRNWANNIVNSVEVKEKYLVNTNDYKIIDYIKPDLVFFLGWSDIVPVEIIKNYFCICLHPSALPKYRGGSPIQNQIMNREIDSAVTFFVMDDGLDTGDIIYQEYLSLDGKLDKIFEDIQKISIRLIEKIINDFRSSNLPIVAQNEEISTTYKRRKPEDSEISIEEIQNNEPLDLYNKIRSLNDPYPNAYIKCKDGKKLFIIDSKYEE